MTDEVRRFPAVEERVETGPVRFGEDWPGTFIRGDNSFNYQMQLDRALDILESHADNSMAFFLAWSAINQLAQLLNDCNINDRMKREPRKWPLPR